MAPQHSPPSREKLGSRAGFLLLSAGCAIGLGNIWRFPFIAGTYGGAAFVLLYLLFLVALALPIMSMEFSVGRASRMNIGGSFTKLQPKGSYWHIWGYLGASGNYVLMMFYTTVTGWMLAYTMAFVRNDFAGMQPQAVGAYFGSFVGDPWSMVGWMLLVVVLGFSVCAIGLQKGVERITKWMMSGLFLIMMALVARSVSLPGAGAGLRFYLMPDFGKMLDHGLWTVIYAAMSQAFFTLSIGVGSMAIFGSYISKERSLTGESVNIMLLDTFAALMAGLIIFPACFAFGVDAGSGPGLVFVTLPNVFNTMAAGRLWGFLFFVFMSFAALSTVVAVFENIVSFGIDVLKMSRKKASLINCGLLFVLSLPCALGFNTLAHIQPFGPGSMILDLEDFIISGNMLPIGSLVYLLFCCSRYGWGWDNFIAEVNSGKGLRFPSKLRWYFTWVVPVVIVLILLTGYKEKFFM